jgi:hypothetical protein
MFNSAAATRYAGDLNAKSFCAQRVVRVVSKNIF